MPTKAGVILFSVALGVGIAAYQTSSNILFITLSLLLATIVASGLLSWMNFRRTAWRLIVQPPFREGETAVVALEVANARRLVPTYSLAFDFRASSGDRSVVFQRDRIEPGETRRIEWSFKPRARGREVVEMAGVSSQFPFGFLDKHFGGRIAHEVHVWPARIEYTSSLAAVAAPQSVGDVLSRAGSGNDFVNLRDYRPGDAFRHIHWKATARQGRLMVRQVMAENHSGFLLHLETAASTWRIPAHFEKLCRFAGSLAEDLFRQGQLVGVAINDAPPSLVRRFADLELFLDLLAVLEPLENHRPRARPAPPNTIRFEPGANDTVHALVRGHHAASA